MTIAERRGLRLLITVTFKPNQLRSHLLPILALDDVESATLVADSPAEALPKLRTVVPPRFLVRLFGRAGAKFVVCLGLAVRDRPDWVVAYHLLPHGLTASLVGRLTRRRVLYHQIGGPTEWQGGGWDPENPVFGRLPRPSRTVERFLLWFVRSCTAVVAMGTGGRDALAAHGVPADRLYVIPPSVDLSRFAATGAARDLRYDVATVGDLIERKRTTDLLAAMARLRETRPDIRCAIIGRGPLEPELRRQALDLALGESVDFLGYRDDVEAVVRSSRVFALPSRWEGLSVALCEAMACGVPPVVANVGDLGDLVRGGENGFLVEAGDIDGLAGRIGELLDDSELHARLGATALEDVRAYVGIERISQLYRELLLRDPAA